MDRRSVETAASALYSKLTGWRARTDTCLRYETRHLSLDAHRSFASPLSVQDAEAILRHTQVFAFGGMPRKRQVQAFNVLFEQPDAVSRFQHLADVASPAGKLYALLGFNCSLALRRVGLNERWPRNPRGS